MKPKVRFSKVYHRSWSPYMIEAGEHPYSTKAKFKTISELLGYIGTSNKPKVVENDFYVNGQGRKINVPVYEVEIS